MDAGRPAETSREVPDERVVRRFLERAASVILESRTLDDARFDSVLALADEVGLTREQLACELRFLELRGVITSAPWDRLDLPDDRPHARPARAGRAADSALARPAAAGPEALAQFRRWVTQKLAGYPSAILAMDDEQGLIGVGTHRYHLADIRALDVVRELAIQHNIRLERDLEGASCHSTVGSVSQMSADDHDWPPPETDDPRQVERREAFRSYLRRTLAQLPDGIVTFKTHRRLMEAGSLFHGVAPQWIQPTINEVASEMGSRFTSEEQAIERVTALVAQRIARDPTIDHVARTEIYAEGTRWGLDPMDVEAILRGRLEQLHQLVTRRQQQVRRRRTIILAGAALAGIVITALGLYLAGGSAQPDLAETPVSGGGAPAADGRRATWWDADLDGAVARSAASHPELAAALAQARAGADRERAEAYGLVIAQCLQWSDQSREAAEIPALLGRWYAADPSDAAARQIPQQLLSPAGALATELPHEGAQLRAAFRGCRTAARIWKTPELDAQRGAYLGALLESVTHETLDRALGATQLENLCVVALARRCYAALPEIADKDAARAWQLYQAVAAETAGRVEQSTLDRFDADLLVAVLPAAGSRWDDYHALLRRTVHSSDMSVVQTLWELVQQASSPQLRQALAESFAQRLGIASDHMTEAELIEAIRTALAATTEDTHELRWDRLSGRADAALRDVGAARDQPDRCLQQTLDCTLCATLACVLTQGEQAAAIFRELEAQEVWSGATDGDAPPEVPSGPFVRAYPLPEAVVIRQHIDDLIDAGEVTQRLTLLRLVANAADTLAEIDPGSGRKLALYLMRPKGQEEHQQLLPQVARLSRWNAVRLGLGDQLAASADGTAHQQEVLAHVLGREVNLRTLEDRQRVVRRLLETVWMRLAEADQAGDEQQRALDHGSQRLGDLYRIQARLLGVPAARCASALYLSEILRALIAHRAGQLQRSDLSALSAAQRELLDGWPRQLAAADYVADNDLQYTVLLQRIWLQLLGIDVAQRVPGRAAAADQIVAQTLSDQAARDRVLDQLCDLEAGLLRLWLLYHPQAEPATSDGKDV